MNTKNNIGEYKAKICTTSEWLTNHQEQEFLAVI